MVRIYLCRSCAINMAIAGATMPIWHKQRKTVSKEQSSVLWAQALPRYLRHHPE
ncbi:hypothetical protein O9929_13220 [Vibrio lentus]|nr:hypothetical protein [Vibrio lentus]